METGMKLARIPANAKTGSRREIGY